MPAARKNAPKSSLAGDASERVRAIIEAAETTAAQIRAAAEEDAERIRAEARSEAEGLLEGLRRGLERLGDELGIGAGPAHPGTDSLEALEPPHEPPPVAAQDPDEDADIQLAQDAAVGLDEGPGDAERESARLVALNMALDGASRDEVDKYLENNFGLSERASLLDEVYATVGR